MSTINIYQIPTLLEILDHVRKEFDIKEISMNVEHSTVSLVIRYNERNFFKTFHSVEWSIDVRGKSEMKSWFIWN